MDDFTALILAAAAAYAVVALVWYIILVVANWKIFTKAGEAGWKSIIPFLNNYVLYKISWNTKMFWVSLGATALAAVFSSLAGENGGFLSVLSLICSVALIVITVMQVHKLSKSFGHGIGFTLGLIFLSPIFTLILGFGKSEYIGPDGVRNGNNSSEL